MHLWRPGSEAVEAAMKLARQYYVNKGELERTHFIARKASFHGTTLGSLALSEKAGLRRPFESLLIQDNVTFVSSPNTYRDMYDDERSENYVKRLETELDEAFSRVGPHTVCAFFAETLSGSVCAHPHVLPRLMVAFN